MTTRTMHTGGFATGAARSGACATLLARTGIAMPTHSVVWRGGSNVKQESPVFPTDRPTRRLLERFP